MKNAMKKLLSLALALVLVVGVFPMAAFAAGEFYTVTLMLKVDDSNEIVATDTGVKAESGSQFNVARYAQNIWSEYDYSHYWTEVTGKQTDALLTVTGDVTVEVRMYSKDVPPVEDEEEDNKEEETVKPATYTIALNVYEVKDNEAKQWGSKSVTLSKNSTTLAELIAESGYGKYESAFAKINGATFEGRAAIAVEDGDQIDLFITPSKGGDKDDNKPSSKPEGDKNEKPGKGEKVTLRVFHNDGTGNFTDIRCRTTDKLLDVIENNDELSELSRDGYKLIGWAFEANNDTEKEWIAAQHTVADDDDLRVYADWQKTKPSKDDGEDEVLLKIYVNGNTKSAAKVVDMDAYDNDGKITLAEAEKVVRKYYEEKYTDDDMDIEGLFTTKTWNSGDYKLKNAKKTIEVNEKGDTIIYVMVHDAQKISSGTADSTNPKTGDTIFMAVTVMALSATALAAVYVFTKKRAVK